jgi:hypothetical protein
MLAAQDFKVNDLSKIHTIKQARKKTLWESICRSCQPEFFLQKMTFSLSFFILYFWDK